MITETLRLHAGRYDWQVQTRRKIKEGKQAGEWSDWTATQFYPRAEFALDEIARQMLENEDLIGLIEAYRKAADHIREIRAQLENDRG